MLRFCIDFGTIFHDFGTILASFFNTFSASILVSIFASILDRFWLQNGSQNGPLGHHFRPKSRLLASLLSDRSVLEPTWARFGAESVPRTHFYRFGRVIGRFWDDVRSIFERFSITQVSKSSEYFLRGSSWRQPVPDLAPKALQGRIFTDLGYVLIDIRTISDQFRMDF